MFIIESEYWPLSVSVCIIIITWLRVETYVIKEINVLKLYDLYNLTEIFKEEVNIIIEENTQVKYRD